MALFNWHVNTFEGCMLIKIQRRIVADTFLHLGVVYADT